MSEQQPPKIQYPCDYPIKIIGETSDEFVKTVSEILCQHCPELTLKDIETKFSKKGKYLSLSVVIPARSEAHIQGLCLALRDYDKVVMLL